MKRVLNILLAVDCLAVLFDAFDALNRPDFGYMLNT